MPRLKSLAPALFCLLIAFGVKAQQFHNDSSRSIFERG